MWHHINSNLSSLKIQSGVDVFSTYIFQDTAGTHKQLDPSLFMYGFSQQLKKKSIAISRQQEKNQNTPGLHIDKSRIIEPLSFLSFKKEYLTVELHKNSYSPR